jgi:adenylosuccinate synthase
LLADAEFAGEVARVGVVRGYATRHGAGPFVTESPDLTQKLPDNYNTQNDWQQSFRVGHFDAVATRYALEVIGGVDNLAVTNLDRMADIPCWNMCDAYWLPDLPDAGKFFELGPNRACNIRVNPVKEDLEHQEKLTQMLLNAARPIYRECSSAHTGHFEERADNYLRLIEKVTGTSVAISSFGPSAKDKRSIKNLTWKAWK